MESENLGMSSHIDESSSCVQDTDVSSTISSEGDKQIPPSFSSQDSSPQKKKLLLSRIGTSMLEDENQSNLMSGDHGETAKLSDAEHIAENEKQQNGEVVLAKDSKTSIGFEMHLEFTDPGPSTSRIQVIECVNSPIDPGPSTSRIQVIEYVNSPIDPGPSTSRIQVIEGVNSPIDPGPSTSCIQAIPAANSQSIITATPTNDNLACKWLHCNAKPSDDLSNLLEHILTCHVQPQIEKNVLYVCLWIGCKVYEQPSTSHEWLKRHVATHCGSRPYVCPITDCQRHCGTSEILQRHVNNVHFSRKALRSLKSKQPEHRMLSTSDPGPSRKFCGPRHKRTISMKSLDSFTEPILEQIRRDLENLSSIPGMELNGPPMTINFRSTIIGARRDTSGQVSLLLHWHPPGLLPDTWVPSNELSRHMQRAVRVRDLSPDALSYLESRYGVDLQQGKDKHRRK